ncbi:hypothetical protein [Nostoc sp. NMS9]|nr:hypothetical protein [Nostoc sp. NMS9]
MKQSPPKFPESAIAYIGRTYASVTSDRHQKLDQQHRNSGTFKLLNQVV